MTDGIGRMDCRARRAGGGPGAWHGMGAPSVRQRSRRPFNEPPRGRCFVNGAHANENPRVMQKTSIDRPGHALRAGLQVHRSRLPELRAAAATPLKKEAR